MLQITFLCPFRLSGQRYGGSYRILGLAAALARAGHSVRVEAFVTPAEGMPAKWNESSRVLIHEHLDWLGLGAAFGRLHLAPRILPVALAARHHRHRLIVEKTDVAIYAYPWLWPAPQVAARLNILDAHNCEANWFEKEISGRPFENFWRNFVRKTEMQAYRETDAVWCVSEADRAQLALRYGPRATAPTIVPNGALPIPRPSDARRQQARKELGLSPDERVALFVGFRMRYNVDALVALAAAQAKRENEKPPTVLVAGTVCEALPPLPVHFRKLGYRKDLEPLVAAADVAINPTLEGSGSNTKLVELLGCGLPVVTTEFGLRGFEVLRPQVLVSPLEGFTAAIAQASERRVDLPSSLHWDTIALNAAKNLHQALSLLPSR